MRRMKWFLPADDGPFDPLGFPFSDSRTVVSLDGRAEGTTPTHATGNSNRVKQMAALPLQPCVPAVRPPGPCAERPSRTLPAGSRRPRSSRADD